MTTRFDDAQAPWVLAIDVGSSSVRTLLFDAAARQMTWTEARRKHQFVSGKDGASTTDPDRLVDLVIRCIDKTLGIVGADARQIAGIGVSAFWHSLLGLDADGRPVTPLLTWADSRSAHIAASLATEWGNDHLLALTGCRAHSSYWPAKLTWIAYAEPAWFTRVTSWVSWPDYLEQQLCGTQRTSVSSASATGLLDQAATTWSAPMLDAVGLTEDQLLPIVDRLTPTHLLPTWRQRWPDLVDAAVFPAIGDGAAANVGAGAVGHDRVALTIGTSGAMRIIRRFDPAVVPPPGLWRYRLDAGHDVIGGALSSGGNVLTWVKRTVGGEMAIPEMVPDSHGLTVLPFLAGERSPSWDDRLGGTISGLRLGTRPADLTRAIAESVAYRFADIYDGLKPIIADRHMILANGGALLSLSSWSKMLADVLDQPICALPIETEASARGAAIIALDALGVMQYVRLPNPDCRRTFYPQRQHGPIYQRARQRQRALERALVSFADSQEIIDAPH